MASLIKRLGPHWPLLPVLLLALGVRVALWNQLPRLGLIGDEAEYIAAADWLALGRGFSWHLGWLWTRAPLYPLFIAAHFALFGRSLEPVFISQIGLSLLNIGLIYALALRLNAGRAAAWLAALLAAIYLPFATYTQLLLSETLFTTLLLAAFLAITTPTTHIWGERLRALSGGAILGLATLTRSLTLGFAPLLGLWLLWGLRRNPKLALQVGAIYALGFAAMLLPWTAYASRAYGGVVVVDTTGAFNLMAGARTAFDGSRSDEPSRNFVLALLDPRLSPEARRHLLDPREDSATGRRWAGACLWERGDPRLLAALDQPVAAISQAQRQQLMSAEGLCLLQAKPLAFINKSLTELVDLFRINYTGAERLTDGFAIGYIPRWYTLALFLLDDTLYVFALPLMVLGWAALRGRGALVPSLALLGLWLLYNLGTAPLLFAINRFRIPLLPFGLILAAAALVQWRQIAWRTPFVRVCAALGAVLWLAAAAPYAYFEPRPANADARWSSYFGPYPSSIANTVLAWNTRPSHEAELALRNALGAGDVTQTAALLAAPEVAGYTRAVAEPLLIGLRDGAAAGLAALDNSRLAPLNPWQALVVRGELLRRLGQNDAARAALSPTMVDDQNPTAWAWAWLNPPPLPGQRLNLADDLDLGYIDGFFLGEFDPALNATIRWSGPVARLRFPQALGERPQQLCLNAAGSGWPTDLSLPSVQVSANEREIGRFALSRELREHCFPLPTGIAADLYVTLRSPTFVPAAADLVGQQGPQVGQLRTLGFQLDWAEVRDAE